MEFTAIDHLEKRHKAALLAIPFWKTADGAICAAEIGKLKGWEIAAITLGDFEGKEADVFIVYQDKAPEQRLALIGLGEKDKITVEKLRYAYGKLAKSCQDKKIADINLILPHIHAIAEEGVIRGVVEGLLLANYVFDKYKQETSKNKRTVLLKKVHLIHAHKKGLDLARKIAAICDGVYLARNLVNGNADEITPQFLGRVALDLAKEYRSVKTTIFDKKRIEKEKMGLLLAVSRASACDPAIIIVEYKGNPKSKDHSVIVGKGVTYDTGGLALKPSGSMLKMKADMAGAAACLGTVLAAAKIGLKVNFTALIPAAENAIGSRSYKLGDVYVAYNGKTVEIEDTDAEGRLILADAMAYAVENLKPTRIIDLATLTGAIGVALGWEAAGLMSNDDVLADALIRASSETSEKLWRMPIFEEYVPQLKSEIADLKNSGGRFAGASTGALFLKEFIGKTPWAHCDIAYTAYLDEARKYQPKNATGFGVRLLVEFFHHL